MSSTAVHVPKPTPRVESAPSDVEGSWPLDLAGFRQAVLDLGLMEPDDLETFASMASVDVGALAKLLVRARKITAYQAAAIAQGKGKGLLIGRYLVLEKRGKGGMGIVFKAKDRLANRLVALKILPPSFGRDADAVLRFRREFLLAARLSHPNVVAAVDADEDRGVQYLTMDYIEGHDLDDLVAAVGPLPIKLAIHCTIQAARGLEAAHAMGIVHRDIKPSNLMLDHSGAVRVLDLGLARVMEASGPIGQSAGGSVTVTGAYMGTVDFVAPEQADDSKKANHLSDIYSLGCTLYFLLTGRPPFEGDTMLKRLMAHQNRPAPTLHAARPDVPPSLERIYQSMMAKRPEDRPRSMTTVVTALEACRSSDDEAKEARATLMNFAETFMKRAQPRTGRRPADASIFAQPKKTTGVQIDSSVNLEDLLMDYREEIHHGPLAEEKLPPKPPRLVAPPRPRRRKSSVPYGVIGLLLGMVIAGYALWPKPARDEAPARRSPVATTSPAPQTTPEVAPFSSPPVVRPAFRPLFNGTDLNGWAGDVGDYEVREGLLSCRPDRKAVIFEPTTRGDFVARVEFRLAPGSESGLMIRYPGEGTASYDSMCEIQILDDSHPAYASVDSRLYTGSAYGMAAARRGSLKPLGEWNVQEVTVRGSTVKVELNGDMILNTDVALIRDFEGDRPHPGKDRTSGYFGIQSGVGQNQGSVQYRKIEIQSLDGDASSSPVATSTVPPLSTLVFVDNFSDPRRGWASDTPLEAARAADHHRQVLDGIYRQDANVAGWWLWTCPKQVPAAFSCEVDARVFGDNPQARGGVMIQVDNGRFGLQVQLDAQGVVRVLKSDPTATGEPFHTTVGPITHPAIKTGPTDFNTINFQVADQKCAIRVNGVLIREPFDIPWEPKPGDLKLGVGCKVPNIRVEYDRIEIREISSR